MHLLSNSFMVPIILNLHLSIDDGELLLSVSPNRQKDAEMAVTIKNSVLNTITTTGVVYDGLLTTNKPAIRLGV